MAEAGEKTTPVSGATGAEIANCFRGLSLSLSESQAKPHFVSLSVHESGLADQMHLGVAGIHWTNVRAVNAATFQWSAR